MKFNDAEKAAMFWLEAVPKAIRDAYDRVVKRSAWWA